MKVLRSDNGGEYMASSLATFLHDQGVIHQFSCPDTPEQNGVAERKNRHLLEVTRALLFEKDVPKRFWNEAVLTATYLINRTMTPVLGNRSPFEVLPGQPPSYEDLRVFWCLCYIHVPDSLRHKLSPTSLLDNSG